MGKETDYQFNRWEKLSDKAWATLENAFIYGDTKVGAAVNSNDKIFSGCNVEQTFRNNDVHAEVNAISNMIASGEKSFDVILIVAKRERFTPCGACMDWIFQFGGKNCLIGFQKKRHEKIFINKAIELMPYYPQ